MTPDHDNAQLLRKFYDAFAQKDGAAMAACYHPEAQFSDPVFTDLKGARPGHMWRMLTERAADLTIEASDIGADDTTGKAHWDATYTFSATGRTVLNRIDARFTFKDRLIHTHTDTFDLWKWTRMALGTPGVLLGWSPIVRNKVRAQAMKGLQAWEAKNVTAAG